MLFEISAELMELTPILATSCPLLRTYPTSKAHYHGPQASRVANVRCVNLDCRAQRHGSCMGKTMRSARILPKGGGGFAALCLPFALAPWIFKCWLAPLGPKGRRRSVSAGTKAFSLKRPWPRLFVFGIRMLCRPDPDRPCLSEPRPPRKREDLNVHKSRVMPAFL